MDRKPLIEENSHEKHDVILSAQIIHCSLAIADKHILYNISNSAKNYVNKKLKVV